MFEPTRSRDSKGLRAQGWSRNLGLWLLMMVLVVAFHFGGSNPMRLLLSQVSLQLTPCLVERLLFLLPVTFSALQFGMEGGVLTIALSLTAMLIRAAVASCLPESALWEITGVLVVAILLNWLLSHLRAERQVRKEVQRHSLEQLRASEERYRRVFENASDAIWVQDGEGRLVTANAACSQLTGYELTELIGQPVERFLREPIAAGCYELSLQHKDGNEVIVEVVASPISRDGQSSGWQCIARDVTERRHKEEATRFFARQVVRAQEEERRRIARELHDGTVQTLAVLSNHLEALELDRKALPQEVIQRIRKLQHMVSDASQEVRHFSQNLRPPALDDLGLLPSLEDLAADLRREQGIAVEVLALGRVQRLDPETELALFRIVQEALNNVRRHANASEVVVNLRFDRDRVRVIVRDDGQGCELPEYLSELTATGRLGLAGIYERAHLLGGKARVESKPGQGTKVNVELPV